MTRGLRLLSLLVPLSAVALAGCYAEVQPAPAATAEVEVEPPPPAPAPVVEEVPVSPGVEFVWAPGHHRWDGRTYVWERGVYVRRPHERAEWVGAHWERRGRGHVWVAGHWR
jgi:hypothetical protein